MDIEDILALKMMNEAGRGDAASAIATECAERHARIHCGGETCEICRFNVEKYVGVRQGRAYQIQADRSHNTLRYGLLFGVIVGIIVIGSLLVSEVIDQQYNREREIENAVKKRLREAQAQTSAAAPAPIAKPVAQPAATTAKPKAATEVVSEQQIKAVCRRVWDTVTDLNHDGKIDCIDYSLRFKEIVQEADFIWNYNPPKMNHLFVRWGDHYIEPQSGGGGSWRVEQFWRGKGYDPAYNKVSIFEDWYTRRDPLK